MEFSEKPLVTLLLVTYNQEKYIAEAIDSAFAQDYENIQIIISDDYSSDATYEILCEHVNKKMYGRNLDLLVRRNVENLGLTAHLNAAISHAKGEFVVLAAGDDISVPHRVSSLVQRWERSNYQTCSIFSECMLITEDGVELGRMGRDSNRSESSWVSVANKDVSVFGSYPGCTQAFTIDSYNLFGFLREGIQQEDIYLQLRSALVGGVGFVTEPLVYYRQTTNSQSRQKKIPYASRVAYRIRYLKSYISVFLCVKEEAARLPAGLNISDDLQRWFIEELENYIAPYQWELRFHEANYIQRLKMALKIQKRVKRKCSWAMYAIVPFLYGIRSSQI